MRVQIQMKIVLKDTVIECQQQLTEEWKLNGRMNECDIRSQSLKRPRKEIPILIITSSSDGSILTGRSFKF